MATGFGAVALLLSFLGGPGWGQGSMVPIDQYTRDRLTTGTTADQTYFAEKDEALTKTIDISQYIQRDEQGREREVTILVQTGRRVFCAHCGMMLQDTVHFATVPMAESVKFYDDGTHGDLVPDDGLPTYIEDLREDYIGPWCYQHKLFLEQLELRARFKDAYSAKLMQREPMEEEEPQSFYSMVKVAPFDKESRLAIDPDARFMAGTPGMEDRYSYWALDKKLDETVEDFKEGVIWEFKRAKTHLDYWLHESEITPYVPQMLAELYAPPSAAALTSTTPYRTYGDRPRFGTAPQYGGAPVNRWQMLRYDAQRTGRVPGGGGMPSPGRYPY